jgi:hypothetical protein
MGTDTASDGASLSHVDDPCHRKGGGVLKRGFRNGFPTVHLHDDAGVGFSVSRGFRPLHPDAIGDRQQHDRLRSWADRDVGRAIQQ